MVTESADFSWHPSHLQPVSLTPQFRRLVATISLALFVSDGILLNGNSIARVDTVATNQRWPSTCTTISPPHSPQRYAFHCSCMIARICCKSKGSRSITKPKPNFTPQQWDLVRCVFRFSCWKSFAVGRFGIISKWRHMRPLQPVLSYPT